MEDNYDKQAEEMAESIAHKIEPFGCVFSNDCYAECVESYRKNYIEPILSTIPLASLLRDKARLDWCRQRNLSEIEAVFVDNGDGLTLRQAIDTAMKENKPERLVMLLEKCIQQSSPSPNKSRKER